MKSIDKLPVIRGLQLIAEAVKEDQPRSDTIRFLLFQVDSFHSDLNEGLQLTDAVWRRNPNGTVSLDWPEEETTPENTVQSQFILPAAMPELVKPQLDVSSESLGLINYVIDLYERSKPKGAVLLSAGMAQAPHDWQMDIYTAVTRENGYQLSLKGAEVADSSYPIIDFEALYAAGTRFGSDDKDLEAVKAAISAPEKQKMRQNREVDVARLDTIFSGKNRPKPSLEAPSGDIIDQLRAQGLMPKQ